MRHRSAELRILRRLVPVDNGTTVFDAETQETSYGIWFFDGLPFIFDTHRKDGWYVATIELLTEVVTPVRIAPERIRRMCASCRRFGLLPVPYSRCFFQGNLHVYSFFGPIHGFDIAAAGLSKNTAERRLRKRIEAVWHEIPDELLRAQHALLAGRRNARFEVDLEVLRRKWRGFVPRHAP